MLNLSINRSNVILILSLCVTLLVACRDDETDPKSFLNSYRILALRAEPAQLSISSQSQLSLYDFHPQDLNGERPNIEYSWRICPFSLGSLTRYECFVDEIPLTEDMVETNAMGEDSNSESSSDDEAMENEDIGDENNASEEPSLMPLALKANSSVTLNPLELFEAFGGDLTSQMEQFEMGAGMLGSEMNFFESGVFEIYIKLTVKVDGESDFEAVKTMTVLLDPEIPVNQHPKITNVSTSVDLEDLTKLDTETEFDIEVEVSADSIEEYKPAQSASDQEQGIEATLVSETPFVYYYTTSGRFDSAVKLVEENLSTLTLGEESGPQKLYIVLRDGRGGVDLRVIDFDIKE